MIAMIFGRRIRTAANRYELVRLAHHRSGADDHSHDNNPKRDMKHRFNGITLGDTIKYRREEHALTGISATVEASGDVDRRITATRLLLTGPFALGLRKKKDNRELFLTVNGPDFQWVVDVDPKMQRVARDFAARVSTAGLQHP